MWIVYISCINESMSWGCSAVFLGQDLTEKSTSSLGSLMSASLASLRDSFRFDRPDRRWKSHGTFRFKGHTDMWFRFQLSLHANKPRPEFKPTSAVEWSFECSQPSSSCFTTNLMHPIDCKASSWLWLAPKKCLNKCIYYNENSQSSITILYHLSHTTYLTWFLSAIGTGNPCMPETVCSCLLSK